MNRTSDSGLYSYNGTARFFSVADGTAPVFASGQFVDLLVSRDASGVFSAYTKGNLALSFSDPNGLAQFTGPNGIIYFFMDDFGNYPNDPEAGSGFINFIQVTSTGAVPEPSTWAMLLLGFAGIGFMAYRRKSKPASMAA
jgi:PEP-CTERM motif